MKYDIIGDVHGQAVLLEKLLREMGYQLDLTSTWYHPNRKAIFLGDIINKGPQIKRTVEIVRQMVEGGYAEMVIGNHECAWMDKNAIGIFSTLEAYGHDKKQLESDLSWIRSLPVYIEKEGFRVVHAYWDDVFIQVIKNWEAKSSASPFAHSNDCRIAILLLVNGPRYRVSPDEQFMQNGKDKTSIRFRWWNLNVSFYDKKEKPLFFGHYCIEHEPMIIQSNICCLDYCVHRTGRLVAYRWGGESHLRDENLFIVSDSR
jgi:hypothetical protein